MTEAGNDRCLRSNAGGGRRGSDKRGFAVAEIGEELSVAGAVAAMASDERALAS